MSLYSSKTYIKDLETSVNETIAIDLLAGHSVIITGATGTIGSFLVDALLYYNEIKNAGITIYAASRSLAKLKKRFSEKKTDQLIYIEYDSAKPITFDFPIDYIVHAAGNAYPAAFNTDPVGTIINNVNGTYNLLEYSRTHGAKRFLFVSSGEVYGQGDLSLETFDESYIGYVDPMSSRSCYPNSKRTTETLCASYYKQYGLDTIIVRPCHTYGPTITENDNRANVQFIKKALNGEDIVLNSPGEQRRSYCYVADCASAIFTILLNGKSGEAYNIANPNARITIAEFAETVAKTTGRKVIYKDPDKREIADMTPIAKQVLDTKKLESLGWSGVYTPEIGIDHMLKSITGK